MWMPQRTALCVFLRIPQRESRKDGYLHRTGRLDRMFRTWPDLTRIGCCLVPLPWRYFGSPCTWSDYHMTGGVKDNRWAGTGQTDRQGNNCWLIVPRNEQSKENTNGQGRTTFPYFPAPEYYIAYMAFEIFPPHKGRCSFKSYLSVISHHLDPHG